MFELVVEGMIFTYFLQWNHVPFFLCQFAKKSQTNLIHFLTSHAVNLFQLYHTPLVQPQCEVSKQNRPWRWQPI